MTQDLEVYLTPQSVHCNLRNTLIHTFQVGNRCTSQAAQIKATQKLMAAVHEQDVSWLCNLPTRGPQMGGYMRNGSISSWSCKDDDTWGMAQFQSIHRSCKCHLSIVENRHASMSYTYGILISLQHHSSPEERIRWWTKTESMFHRTGADLENEEGGCLGQCAQN